jgi:hypothetical protein
MNSSEMSDGLELVDKMIAATERGSIDALKASLKLWSPGPKRKGGAAAPPALSAMYSRLIAARPDPKDPHRVKTQDIRKMGAPEQKTAIALRDVLRDVGTLYRLKANADRSQTNKMRERLEYLRGLISTPPTPTNGPHVRVDVDAIDLLILAVFNKGNHIAWTQNEVIEAIDKGPNRDAVSPRTLSDRLTKLRKSKLIVRPRGKKQRDRITQKGLDFLTRTGPSNHVS